VTKTCDVPATSFSISPQTSMVPTIPAFIFPTCKDIYPPWQIGRLAVPDGALAPNPPPKNRKREVSSCLSSFLHEQVHILSEQKEDEDP